MERHDEIEEQVVGWPPLHDGHNEPGPTDQAGEYRTGGEQASASPRARTPGEVWPGEKPADVASECSMLPEVPEGELTAAERAFGDPRHIARGKHATSSSEGSS